MSLRILHVIPNIERGGAERVMLLLARGAKKAGHHVEILVLGWKNEYLSEIGDDIPCRLLNYPLTYRRVLATWRCLQQIRRIIREFKPDIVHSHLWPAARMAGWALLGQSIPHVVHVHDSMAWLEQPDLRSRFLRVLTKSALAGRNTHFIAVGRSVAEYTKRHLPWVDKRIDVIHNGFDAELFLEFRDGLFRNPSSGNSKLVFGTAARLVPNKGIDRCLRALAGAKIDGAWNYLIAGDGSQRSVCQDLANHLKIGDRVNFLGAVTDMPRFYRCLDVYIQPSSSLEGSPLAIVEAMACGVPIIATDVGSTGELVTDGIEGCLVPPDDVAALAMAIEKLSKSPILRQEMARNAHRRAWSEFSSTEMVRKVLDKYRTILSPPNSDIRVETDD